MLSTEGFRLCRGILGLPPLIAYVAVSTQPNPNSATGTIALLDGGGGVTFFNQGGNDVNGNATSYLHDYYFAGYTTVQLAWAGPWEENSADVPLNSFLQEACRPATLLKWINDNYARPSTGPMCAQGHSGDAGALGYALAWYGANRGSASAAIPIPW